MYMWGTVQDFKINKAITDSPIIKKKEVICQTPTERTLWLSGSGTAGVGGSGGQDC